jgi:hypothetical protein
VRLYKVDLIRCLLLCFALLAFGAQFIVTEMVFFRAEYGRSPSPLFYVISPL